MLLTIALAHAGPIGFVPVLNDLAPVDDLEQSLFVADLDGDGTEDLAASGPGGGWTVSWYPNTGAGLGARQLVASPQAPYAPYAADLDLDGDLDLLYAAAWDANLVWHENVGGAFGGAIVIAAGLASPQAVSAADLDGDCYPDPIVAQWFGDDVHWAPSRGDGTFDPLQTVGSVVDPIDLVAADLDGDDDIDVVSSGWSGGGKLHENLGGGTFVTTTLFPHGNGWAGIEVGDLDGDGDDDLLGGSRSVVGATDLWWYENVGGGPPVRRAIGSVGNTVYGVDPHLADLDCDGDPDAVYTFQSIWAYGWADADAGWIENVGGGAWSAPQVAFTGLLYYGDSPKALDADGDGDRDLVAWDYYGGAKWLENTSDCSGGDESWKPDPPTGCDLPPADPDGDGWAAPQDCDEGDAAINPGEVELPDGIDQDCDGVADEVDEVPEDTDAPVPDDDDDDDGVRASDGDCDDDAAAVHPGAPEQPDGVDEDCDGLVDDGTVAFDDDGDGVTELDGDCDDTDPARLPGAEEVVNGVDDDCDGLADDGADRADDDGDGLSEAQGDCDDTDAAVNAGAPERANGVDDDCDGLADEGAGVVERSAPASGGCGCRTGASPALGWVVVIALLGRRRPG